MLGQEQSPFQRARDDYLGWQHGGESRVQPGGLSGWNCLDRLGAGIEVTAETPRHLQDPVVIVSRDAVEGHRDVLFLRVARTVLEAISVIGEWSLRPFSRLSCR
ncbi:MAG: hypothetical protein ACRDQY_15045 [Pseudonocardiaceae bacterium]